MRGTGPREEVFVRRVERLVNVPQEVGPVQYSSVWGMERMKLKGNGWLLPEADAFLIWLMIAIQ